MTGGEPELIGVAAPAPATGRAGSGTGASGTAGGSDARRRILDVALALMSEQGSAAVSMRQVAAGAGVNVATVYHHVESKAALLRAVIEERRYGQRLAVDRPPVPGRGSPVDRLTGLVGWLWEETLAEEPVFRLIVGEAIRGEAAATASVRAVVDGLTTALETWLAELLPEHAVRAGDLASVVRDEVFAMIVEHLTLGGVTPEDARRRAQALGRLALP
ncbi:MAG: TetR/AcrR family transcriptional regulator [Actinomycetota bacterium]